MASLLLLAIVSLISSVASQLSSCPDDEASFVQVKSAIQHGADRTEKERDSDKDVLAEIDNATTGMFWDQQYSIDVTDMQKFVDSPPGITHVADGPFALHNMSVVGINAHMQGVKVWEYTHPVECTVVFLHPSSGGAGNCLRTVAETLKYAAERQGGERPKPGQMISISSSEQEMIEAKGALVVQTPSDSQWFMYSPQANPTIINEFQHAYDDYIHRAADVNNREKSGFTNNQELVWSDARQGETEPVSYVVHIDGGVIGGLPQRQFWNDDTGTVSLPYMGEYRDVDAALKKMPYGSVSRRWYQHSMNAVVMIYGSAVVRIDNRYVWLKGSAKNLNARFPKTRQEEEAIRMIRSRKISPKQNNNLREYVASHGHQDH